MGQVIRFLNPNAENVNISKFLNPNAENVNISHVNVACTFNKSELQPGTSGHNVPADQEVAQPKTAVLQNDELQNKIENTLKDLYKTITLPSLPWLEMIDIPIEKYITLQLTTENEQRKRKIIELENLFDDIDEEKRKRILIESQPGFGKTTLAHKIVSDWAKSIKYTERFKYAILIILREYSSNSLKDELMDTVTFENCAPEDVWRELNSNETLLILDGFDEISETLKQNILCALFDSTDEYKMVMLVTCRIGLSSVSRRDVISTFRGVSRSVCFWNKTVTILGINEENRTEFLQNFVDESDKEKLMPRLNEIIESRKRMFESPLILMLLVYVMSENLNVKIDTNTDLYKNLVDCIIRRSINKRFPDTLSIDFSLFDNSTSDDILFNDCKEKFVEFGKLCLNQLLNDKLQFDSNVKNEEVHQLGFLLKHIIKKNLGVIVRYEGFHLSILEFAAAVYVCVDFERNENSFRPETIDKLLEYFNKKKCSTLVTSFLCDLLQNNLVNFIDQLSHKCVYFWINEEVTQNLFMDCRMNYSISILECFVKLAPPYSRVKDRQRMFALKYPQMSKFLVAEFDQLSCLCNIHTPNHFRVVMCDVTKNQRRENTTEDNDSAWLQVLQRILSTARNIACDSLFFKVNNDALCNKDMINYMKIFSKISSKCKSLHIDNRASAHSKCFEDCINNGVLDGQKLQTVVVELWNYGEKGIEKLTEICQIENLTLIINDFSNSNFATRVSYMAAKSKLLNSLQVVSYKFYEEFCVDLRIITENSDKTWEFLYFDNARVECSASLDNSRCIKSFSLNPRMFPTQTIRDIRTLLSVTPEKLHCNSHTLELLSADINSSSWGGWETIEELKLTVAAVKDIDGSKRTGFGEFSKFKKLKILTMIILTELKEADLQEIIENIKNIKLHQFKLRSFSSCFNSAIIEEVHQLILTKAFNCSENITFVITLNERDITTSEFQTIKSALRVCDLKIIFNIVGYTWNILNNFMEKHLCELYDCNVKYSCVPCRLENMPISYTSSNSQSSLGYDYYKYAEHVLQLTIR